MTLKESLQDFSTFRNAYILAGSAAMGSIFYGWDMCVQLSTPLYVELGFDQGLQWPHRGYPCAQFVPGVFRSQSQDGCTEGRPQWKHCLCATGGLLVSIVCLSVCHQHVDFWISFGALSTGYFSGRFGRKKCLLASGVIYLVGSAIQSIVGLGSSQEVGLRVLYFSRFLGGVGVGMVSALVPAYVSECTPQTIRGRCTGLCQFANNVGIMLSCKGLPSILSSNMS